MDTLLAQIRSALTSNLYYLALYTSITLPDLCGALESSNGWATESKYIAWFDKHVAPGYDGLFTGDDCYKFRCSLLHQGRMQHNKSRYERIVFVEPNPQTQGMILHRNVVNNGGIMYLNLDLRLFCLDILAGVEKWLIEVRQSPQFRQNLTHFAQRYPDGFPPLIAGIPVVS